MRIVVVDDSERRVGLIEGLLEKYKNLGLLDVEYCDSADAARVALRDPCDLLVLDILIPKKRNATARAANSVELLRDVCDPGGRFIRPGMVFGITADEGDIGTHRSEFVKFASTVVSAPHFDESWLASLDDQVQSVLSSRAKASSASRDRVLITVHGIRTYGLWQQNLRRRLESYSRDFRFYEVKYGFLDLLSFCVPYLRNRVSSKVASRIVRIINEEGESGISIVAHSFGTIIVSEAMAMDGVSRKLDSIIFCGSPLPASHNVDHVESKVGLFINDCGTRDFVLLAARVLLPGLGDAGRVGFIRENSPGFMNRFFRGGHSLYFESHQAADFCDRNWVGALTRESGPEFVDQRTTYFGQDVVGLLMSVAEKGKSVLIIAMGVALLAGIIFYCLPS